MLVHRRFYAWIQANPGKVDFWLAVAATLLFALPFLLMRGGQFVEFALSAAICMALAWRRRRPVAAAAVQAAACILQLFLVPVTALPADLFVFATVYSLAAFAPRWASVGGLILASVGGVLFIMQYSVIPSMESGYSLDIALTSDAPAWVALEAVLLVAWMFGDLTRTRRLALRALQDRAHRLEVERQQERELAAADERSHIAREMHDIVAHSLSVIITQADGARYASAKDPEVAPKTLGVIAETGRGSLREMRRLLGVLRGDEAASTRPLPSLADVEELLGTVKRSGLETALSITGTPRRPLPPGAELTAYRVVQESLTNVLKHAGPEASAEVTLQWTPAGLKLGVLDNGLGAASALHDDGAGQGIKGMDERLSLYDGTLTAAPAAGGGFRVEAFIPYTEA
ncbi:MULTISPECIES: histidine kinase [unclassified Arthrobacter]|uniref:sensor histidine kinase n=1 Tax=unclassified Arthrobacter TaxID=235627 RepID=UPI001E5668FE|nr:MULTISPECIES: histidine kinase [unclassified Arthrobacter]MCC9146629.1 histidine kinase [Arthrobacter sp. zg-Y919]MDK1277859.1 histidine kinase [Arthrobacter sp. zg.Y919]WIB02191.1 histidine kinase [Arthrobacter sp. zg-Y919]